VVIVGGCGRTGLALAIAFADRGARVVSYDISEPAVAAVSAARMPFAEPGAALPLERAVVTGALTASADPRIVRSAEHVIIAVPETDLERAAYLSQPSRGRHAACGTAGPEGWTPALTRAVRDCAADLRDGQLLVLRAVVSPGATAWLERFAAGLGLDVDVAYCPQRPGSLALTAPGPQLVASRTGRGRERASRLFGRLTRVQVPMTPEEAELATLVAGEWPYPAGSRGKRRATLPSSR